MTENFFDNRSAISKFIGKNAVALFPDTVYNSAEFRNNAAVIWQLWGGRKNIRPVKTYSNHPKTDGTKKTQVEIENSVTTWVVELLEL